MFKEKATARYTIPFNVSLDDEQCIVCGKPTTFCCSRCRRVYYCSQTCQRTDWRSHKLTCTESEGTPAPSPALAGEGLPEPTNTALMDTIAGYDRAGELLKQGLMSRFGSIVGAYEWFDVQTEGMISFSEFEKTLMSTNVVNGVVVRELFSTLDREGSGKISLSGFLSDAVKKLHPRGLDLSLGVPPASSVEEPSKQVFPTDPANLPPGRRALRAASILAFRNGRFDDAIVSSLQALGITSPSVKALGTIQAHPDNLVELLLLARAMVLTNQEKKGEGLVDLISKILLPVTDVFPAHVTATLLCAAGDISDQYGLSDKAERFYEEYVDLAKNVFGSESLVFGDALTIASGFFLKKKDLHKALELSSLAKEIRSNNLTPPHARLADAISNYATVLKMGRQFDSAIGFFKEAAEQRVQLFGPNALPVADSFFAIGSCFIAIEKPENYQEANKFLSGSHAIRLKVLGPGHPDSLAAADSLRRLKNVMNQKVSKHRRNIYDLAPTQSNKIEIPASPRLTRSSAFIRTDSNDAVVTRQHLTPIESSRSFSVPSASVVVQKSVIPEIDPYNEDVEEQIIRENEDKEKIYLDNEDVVEEQADADNEDEEQGDIGNEDEEQVNVITTGEDELRVDAVRSPRASSGFFNSLLKKSTSNTAPLNEKVVVDITKDVDKQVISPERHVVDDKGLVEVIEYASFPPSPFADSLASLGSAEFLHSLLTLEPNLILNLNFFINESLPIRIPPWLTVTMRGVYFRHALAEEAEPGSEGMRIAQFFTDLKLQEKNLKLIFKLLNSINKTICTQAGNKKVKELDINSFGPFIESRTQNVALLDYFVEVLQKQNPGLIDQLLPGLQSIEEVLDVDFASYTEHLSFVTKSISQIEKALSSLSESSVVGGSSTEGNTMLAVLRMKPEIKTLRLQLEERTKIVAAGTAALLDLFKVKKADAASSIDSAVDCLDELYLELSNILFGEESQQDEGEQDEKEELEEDEEIEYDDDGADRIDK